MIVKKVKYYSITHTYQSSGITCGPTSLKMVMSSYGFFESEDFFKQLCQTKGLGTDADNLHLAIEFLGGHSRMYINSNLNTVQQYIDKGYKVIIGYGYGRGIVGHYAVCTKVDSKHIHLCDPIHGPNHTYGRYYFEKEMWNLGSHMNGKKWFLAIKFGNMNLDKETIDAIEIKNSPTKPVFKEPEKKSLFSSYTLDLDQVIIGNSYTSKVQDPYYQRLQNEKENQRTIFDQRFWDFWIKKK